MIHRADPCVRQGKNGGTRENLEVKPPGPVDFWAPKGTGHAGGALDLFVDQGMIIPCVRQSSP
jgi:hypothetical protein